MPSAPEILVTILSIFLAIFLVLSITLAVYLIKLTRDIRSVTKAASRTMEGFETSVKNISKLTTPMFVIDIITKYIKKYKKNNKGE